MHSTIILPRRQESTRQQRVEHAAPVLDRPRGLRLPDEHAVDEERGCAAHRPRATELPAAPRGLEWLVGWLKYWTENMYHFSTR